MSFELLPAIDIVAGQAVRLDRGEEGTEKTYGDPVEAARFFQDHGAQWLHVVDLDAAFDRGNNHDVLSRVAAKVSVNLQLTGGIRTDADLERALDSGADRIVIGTAALENPDWIRGVLEKHADKIVIDLALREVDGQWRTRGHGWVSDGGDLWEVLERFDQAGCQRFLVTDVFKDGMLQGPNIELLRDIAMATDASLTASGGVTTVDDVAELAKNQNDGIDSAVIGKALYEGKLNLPDALDAARNTEALPPSDA